ncbi:MAG: class I SAM-dependent methyltransferase [Candidatus Promineifilaceae bacterium]|nr:class I SAM-dependent methyltransferase [Candidatus Promineifilaceae bacterium]
MDIRAHNRAAWDKYVQEGNPWTVPVDAAAIEAARRGEWSVVLTELKPVPRAWFPPLDGARVLALASGGGQQGPILAAAGARVTVFDNSPRQLARDATMAAEFDLPLRTVEGDMRDLSALADASFDLVFHPVSNVFVPEVRPVWREAYRVLRPGGLLLAGFMNPVEFIFDHGVLEAEDRLVVRFSLPYSDADSISEEERAARFGAESAYEFSHTLEAQIGGQLEAGFLLTALYEDYTGATAVKDYFPSYIATRAVKLGQPTAPAS